MSLLQFAAGDKDYIDKLNQMSQNAGDTAQLKADTQQIKAETQQIKTDTQAIQDATQQLKTDVEGIKAATQAIAAADLLWQEISVTTQVNHGDLLLATSAGVEVMLDDLKTNLAVGHWFSVSNESDGLIYVNSRADLALVGRKLTVTNDDRMAISPGHTFTFRAKSLTELRIN
ncbi:hypothetical protein KIH87_03375 [Paraneptunicella aestuarii]|uniref:hypothetical protein n=1 Tax=Paraneptunicella aestuarii TaxID=2831148 RepID=UPI001E2C76DA|nr:hypothetical protein [Paraneptunicella aestuarii]UAA39412.1 hypothetical protein KIH87_03375 [Paraneptunicella aestuarii]